MTDIKEVFNGRVISVQPRIRLIRSFDERSHNYLGYSLRIEGKLGEQKDTFLIGIGKAAQAKHNFQDGDVISGECLSVPDPRLEPVDFYKVSKLKIIKQAGENKTQGPPWEGVPSTLEEYRRRGHRRLAARTYDTKCTTCIWGCCMAVEIIIDQWKPNVRKYRYETFCYGPKSCMFYKPGPIRKVPGRHGMVWYGKKKTGLMRKKLLTEMKMNNSTPRRIYTSTGKYKKQNCKIKLPM